MTKQCHTWITIILGIKLDESYRVCIRYQRKKNNAAIYGISHKYRPTGWANLKHSLVNQNMFLKYTTGFKRESKFELCHFWNTISIKCFKFQIFCLFLFRFSIIYTAVKLICPGIRKNIKPMSEEGVRCIEFSFFGKQPQSWYQNIKRNIMQY